MRIVLIGVSHWHVPFYLDPCLALPGVTVVGVSDDDLTRAAPVAAQAGCPAFAGYREMCAELRPDFAFALGRHCDMPVLGRFLIEARIPFAMEKPCGTSLDDVRALTPRTGARQPTPSPRSRSCSATAACSMPCANLTWPGRRFTTWRSSSSAAWSSAIARRVASGCWIVRPPVASR